MSNFLYANLWVGRKEWRRHDRMFGAYVTTTPNAPFGMHGWINGLGLDPFPVNFRKKWAIPYWVGRLSRG